MGSGTKTKHQAYIVAPAPAAPEVDVDDLPATIDWDGIENATGWEAAGYTPWEAHGFIEQGIDDPQQATKWIAHDFNPLAAGAWTEAGFQPETAEGWSGYGFEPSEAAAALEKGLTPTEAIAKQAVALYEPTAEPEQQAEEEQGEEEAEPSLAPVDDVAPISTLAEAEEISEAAWHEAVTPIPDQMVVGDPRGVPLLIGGADLEDSSATIMAYQDAGGGPAHEVLFCRISEEAETKLLQALAPTEDKLIQVTHDVQYQGRLEVDEQQQIFENLKTAAVSVNHHLKAGDGFPTHTLDRIEQLKQQMVAASSYSDDPQLAQMVAHYKPLVDALAERVQPGYSAPYAEGGKAPQVTPFEGTFTKPVTEWVPDTSEGPTGTDLLAASARNASRIDPTIKDGVSTWDGKSRSHAKGKEYVIQLPNGYTAIYHPYNYIDQNLASDDYSLRGRLELQAPAGEGHAKEMVDVLGSMNIVNRPMNGAEAEWTYLDRNIRALGLEANATIAKAIATSKGLEAPVQEMLMYEHQYEAAELLANQDEEGFKKLVRRIALESEAAALPRQVRIVRDAVAKAVGMSSGKELAANPAYQPMPRKVAGRMVFDRFDVARDKAELDKSFSTKRLFCHVTGAGSNGAGILDIFRNGGILASQERRRMMGITKGVGMSEGADASTGGAGGTFVRIGSKSGGKHANQIIWEDPVRLLRRSDWYAFNGDHFGSINPASHHSVSGQTKSPSKVASFGASNNEVIFADGLDLLGDDAPTKVVCSSASERDAVRKLLASRGITHLGTRKIEDVIVSP